MNPNLERDTPSLDAPRTVILGRADLDRRLLEMIERYRELNAKKRAAGS